MLLLEELTEKQTNTYNPNGINNSFIINHGWSNKDEEIFNTLKQAFENRQANRTQDVMAGDRIIIKDKTGKEIFYNYGMAEKADHYKSGFGVCEQPSCCVGLNKDNTLPQYFSISGGSFRQLDTSKLKYVGECERIFWTWGSHGACGNGGIYVPCKVNCYELITDDEFIPYEVTRLYNSDFGYKYKIERRHSLDKNNLSGKCFKTIQGLVKYLRNHKMYITGKETYTFRKCLKVSVNKEFNVIWVNNSREFRELLQQADNSFAELKNGNYWRTFTIENTQYLPNYLEEFKLNYHACNEIYG